LYLVPSHCRIPPNFPFTLCTGWERLRKVRKQESIWPVEVGVLTVKPRPQLIGQIGQRRNVEDRIEQLDD
jgi:hypothetical protein